MNNDAKKPDCTVCHVNSDSECAEFCNQIVSIRLSFSRIFCMLILILMLLCFK